MIGDATRAPTIEVIQADITTLAVDAVVNAANPALTGGAGVNAAIHRAAGAAALSAACMRLHGCATGDAKATPGFALPARWIIHTVGPVWSGGNADEDVLLASCYRRSVEVADELGSRSVAFPAISTGIYGFPADRAAEVAVSTLRGVRTHSVERVVLVAFDDDTRARYDRLVGPHGGDNAMAAVAGPGR